MDLPFLAVVDPTYGRRPVDWRWQLAGHYANVKRAEPGNKLRRVDPETVRVCNFRLAADAATTEPAKLDLWRSYRDLYVAYNLYAQKEGASDLSRFEVEARLLGGQGPDEVAARGVFEPETVRAYAATFFDVASRVNAPSFVVNCVLGRNMHIQGGIDAGRVPEFAWKVYGWVLGPAALDWLAYKGRGSNPADNPADTLEMLDAVYSRTLRVKAVQGMHTLGMGGDGIPTITEAYGKLRDIEHQAAQAGASTAAQDILSGLKKTLEDFAFRKANFELAEMPPAAFPEPEQVLLLTAPT